MAMPGLPPSNPGRTNRIRPAIFVSGMSLSLNSDPAFRAFPIQRSKASTISIIALITTSGNNLIRGRIRGNLTARTPSVLRTSLSTIPQHTISLSLAWNHHAVMIHGYSDASQKVSHGTFSFFSLLIWTKDMVCNYTTVACGRNSSLISVGNKNIPNRCHTHGPDMPCNFPAIVGIHFVFKAK